jgi:hypothetical protein
VPIKKEDYFSKENEVSFMSYSQFSSFLDCEAKALAIIEGRYEEKPSKAFLVGGYVDAFFSGEMEGWKAKHPEAFKKDGSLISDLIHADEIIEAVQADSYFSSFFGGEKQVIETGEISGVPFKIKMDSLFPDKIVDQKTMKDVADIWVDGEKLPFWKAYHYDIQAAIYQEIHAQNSGVKLPYYLAVATKEDTPDKQLFRFSQQTLDAALDLVRTLAPRFDAIKRHQAEAKECGKCDYCKSVKRLSFMDIKEI